MKKIIIASAAVLMGSAAYAQSAIDAYRLSQSDLKGTARYMSMAGAFGALGGDLSTLSHNPAGIGVYRNSDVGFTLDLDLQNSETASNIGTTSIDQTKFLLNNIGVVWTLKLPSANIPNVNFGFTYNKDVSFNKRYRGQIGLTNSLSNYIAANATESGYTEGMLLGYDENGQTYDPYNPPSSFAGADWLSILGYDGYLMSDQSISGQGNRPNYIGQWGSQTSGYGYFDVIESGAIDSYNIALGGNISNVVFWGMDFDITHINYNLTPTWGENLKNARVGEDNGSIRLQDAQWQLDNYYNCSGTGFNYKLGLIIKPIQEVRVGFAFETPTWYGLTETFGADLYALYGNQRSKSASTNGGTLAYNNVNFRSPWKLNASLAVVLFNKLIVSAEYEWQQYKKMKYSQPDYFGGNFYPWDDPNDGYYPGDGYFPGDGYYPWYYSAETRADFDPFVDNNPYYYTNKQINEYFCNTNTLRLGAEFRVTPKFSVRAGYSFVSSPVKSTTKDNMVVTVGTIPNYRLDNTTNYATCGLGYRIGAFYVDLAYVYKHKSAEYFAYSPYYPVDDDTRLVPSQTAAVKLNNSQIVLTAGFKF